MSGVLKLRKNQNAKNAGNGKIARNWNVSGTRIFIVTVVVDEF